MPHMCESCATPPSSHRLPWVRFGVLALATLGAVVILIVHPGARSSGPKGTLSNADRVFLRDLTGATSTGARQASLLGSTTSGHRLASYAASYARRERAWLGKLRLVNRSVVARARSMSMGDALPASGRTGLRRHSEQDVLLARIELSTGRNPDLRRLAQDLLRSERANLRVLARITDSSAGSRPLR